MSGHQDYLDALGPIEALEIARDAAKRAGDEVLAKRLSNELKRLQDPAFDMWQILEDFVQAVDSIVYYNATKLEGLSYPTRNGTVKLPEFLRSLQERSRAVRAAYADERGWS